MGELSSKCEKLPDAQRVVEVICAQSDSGKPSQVEGGKEKEEIQSVGKLSSECDKLPDALRVTEVPCAQIDSDKLCQVEGGDKKQEIQRVGELSQECEKLPDAQRVAEVTCTECRRTWRRVKSIRMDNMIRRSVENLGGVQLGADTVRLRVLKLNIEHVGDEIGPSLEMDKVDMMRISTEGGGDRT